VNAILNYLVHLALAALLLVVFFKAYTWMTPYDEVKLIRQGNHAAALSLGGAMLGFSMTIASSILHTNDWQQFLPGPWVPWWCRRWAMQSRRDA